MRAIVGLFVLILALPVSPVVASDPQVSAGEEPADPSVPAADEESGVPPSPDAMTEDLALMAEGHSWTIEEAGVARHATDVVGDIAEQIARERPDIYIGAAAGDEPGQPPTLYIKGPADAFVSELVSAADIEIIVADNQPFSFAELEERKLRVHHALEALGFRYVTTSVHITGAGVIPAGVTAQPGVPVEASQILAALPADLRASVQLTVNDAPVAQDFAAFGGMWVLDNGQNACTSGWSVRSIATGTLGISTAGHCIGMDQVNHPGHGLHALTFRGRHRGEWGDIEWYSTAEPEPDDFYADAANIRDVAAIEPRANIVVGEGICVYGRMSNDRDCSLDVQDVSQACTNDGVFNDRLVMMDGVTSVPGDSGGGWSFNFTAYGSVKGLCAPNFLNRETFSVADLYDEALGVRVTCGC